MDTGPRELVGFRTLQAIHDLRHLASLATDETLKRIGAGIPAGDGEARLRHVINEQGCMLTGEDARVLHTALLLAATLPDDDHDAFVTSTAVLLGDRLQSGAGPDDLYWHWDAFQSHYDLIEAAGRAAVLQGYLRAHRDEHVNLSDPPQAGLCSTLDRETVVSRLRGIETDADAGVVAILQVALSGGDAEVALDIWASAGRKALGQIESTRRVLIAAFRHLYETDEGWDPYPATMFSPKGELPDLIPILVE